MTSQIICYISASSSRTWWIPPSNTGSFLQQDKITCLCNEQCKEMTSQNIHFICTAGGVQWQILDFPWGGRQLHKWVCKPIFFAENFMHEKERIFAPRGCTTLAPPLDPPLELCCVNSPVYCVIISAMTGNVVLHHK